MPKRKSLWKPLLLGAIFAGLVSGQSTDYEDDDFLFELALAIHLGIDPFPYLDRILAIYTGLPFVDPAPPNAPPIPNVPFRALLLRQPDCSLTRFAQDASGKSLSTYPNYQDYLHAVSGLRAVPDRFPTGCNDPRAGIMSQQAFSLGPVANENVAYGLVSISGVKVYLVNASNFGLISTTGYSSIPSPNPDTLAPIAVYNCRFESRWKRRRHRRQFGRRHSLGNSGYFSGQWRRDTQPADRPR